MKDSQQLTVMSVAQMRAMIDLHEETDRKIILLNNNLLKNLDTGDAGGGAQIIFDRFCLDFESIVMTFLEDRWKIISSDYRENENNDDQENWQELLAMANECIAIRIAANTTLKEKLQLASIDQNPRDILNTWSQAQNELTETYESARSKATRRCDRNSPLH